MTLPTRSCRRWLLPLLLITLISGGWLIYAWLYPTLRPVTKRIVPKDTRFIFSANRTGYPATRYVCGDRDDPVQGWITIVDRSEASGT